MSPDTARSSTSLDSQEPAKNHLAIALGAEPVKAGRSVYFCTLAEIIAGLAQAEREDRSASSRRLPKAGVFGRSAERT